MSKIKSYTKLTMQITVLWLILFSLAPCAVKEFVGSYTGFSSHKSLNRSKATVSQPVCQTSLEAFSNQLSSFKNSFIKRDILSSQTTNLPVIYLALHVPKKTPKVFSSNSPPKYILYKRLKIATA